MAEVGMPNKFYSYKASYGKGKMFAGNVSGNRANDDSGVFIVENQNYASFGPLSYRRDASNGLLVGTSMAYSGINMCTVNSNTKNWSFGITYAVNIGCILSLYQGIPYSNATYSNYKMASRLSYKNTVDNTCSLSVYKTELAYKMPDAEYVYTTGLSAISFAEDGSIDSYATMILARLAPTDGTEYPTLGAISGLEGTYCTDASVVFSGTGKCLGILESNDTASITSTSISTSFPESALAANDGVIAVACMASADGKARWIGYKNGIYKLYHGPKPMFGMPGERMTIKGHEFVCLAYGPFYARLS